METLKEPAVIITVVNTTILTFSIIYFYRQNKILNDKINEQEQKIAILAKKLEKIENANKSLIQYIKEQDTKYTKLDNKVSNLSKSTTSHKTKKSSTPLVTFDSELDRTIDEETQDIDSIIDAVNKAQPSKNVNDILNDLLLK